MQIIQNSPVWLYKLYTPLLQLSKVAWEPMLSLYGGRFFVFNFGRRKTLEPNPVDGGGG
jgi:hypothetical protein